MNIQRLEGCCPASSSYQLVWVGRIWADSHEIAKVDGIYVARSGRGQDKSRSTGLGRWPQAKIRKMLAKQQTASANVICRKVVLRTTFDPHGGHKGMVRFGRPL